MKRMFTACALLLMLLTGFVCAVSAEDTPLCMPPERDRDVYVYCTHQACPGYCYVYDSPDSMYSRNLGRMNNGTRVTVHDCTSNSQGDWYHISGYNTRGVYICGYVHSYCLADSVSPHFSASPSPTRDPNATPKPTRTPSPTRDPNATPKPTRTPSPTRDPNATPKPWTSYTCTIQCNRSSCPGYCYVYDSPDSMYSRNLGRMNNGNPVTVYSYTRNNQGGWYYISGYNTRGVYICGYIHSDCIGVPLA